MLSYKSVFRLSTKNLGQGRRAGAANSYLTNILKNISDGILFIDLEGTMTMMNEPAQKLLKLKPEEGSV